MSALNKMSLKNGFNLTSRPLAYRFPSDLRAKTVSWAKDSGWSNHSRDKITLRAEAVRSL